MRRANRSHANEPAPFSIAPGITPYSFRLYVAGSNLKSREAIEIVQRLCEAFPAGRCKLEVVDLYQQPDMARQDNIIALPSLVKVDPPPRRIFIGITQDTSRILRKLGIPITGYGQAKTKQR